MAKELSQANKGYELQRDKMNIHEMLYQIVSTSTNLHSKLITLKPTHSHSRDLGVIALQCLPSPKLAVALQESVEIAVPSPVCLADVRDDIDIGYPTPDNTDTNSSFIFDTLITEYPELQQSNDLKRLYELIRHFFRSPGSKNTHSMFI